MKEKAISGVIIAIVLATTIGVTPILLQSHTEGYTWNAPLVQVAASGNKV
jgi:hypothetical protein